MALACIPGGLLMEAVGRKTTHLMTTLPCFIGWLTITYAPDYTALLIGRFLTGLCGGLIAPSTSVYIAETSAPKYRGLLLASVSLAQSLGLLTTHLLGTYLHWKTTAVITCALPAMAVVLLAISPESPAWLAKKGHAEQAETAFYWCRDEGEESKREIVEIINRHSNSPTSNVKLTTELSRRQFLWPLCIIVVFIVCNQWTGVNAMTFYTVTIMRTTLKTIDEYVAMLIIDVIRVGVSLLACIILKKLGRRPLALISGTGTTISLLTLSIFTYLKRDDGLTVVPMTSLVAYIVFVTVGFVPLPWVMMGEVFPLRTRNIGSAITSFMAFSAFFTVVKTSPAMFECLGGDGTFLVYGLVALFGTGFVYFCLPETKDRPLYMIEDRFQNKNSTEN